MLLWLSLFLRVLLKHIFFLIIRKLKDRVNYCSDKGTELAQIQLNRSTVLSGRSAIWTFGTGRCLRRYCLRCIEDVILREEIFSTGHRSFLVRWWVKLLGRRRQSARFQVCRLSLNCVPLPRCRKREKAVPRFLTHNLTINSQFTHLIWRFLPQRFS